jgi:hypothetical protein
VRIELLLNGTLGITELAETMRVCGRLSVAIFTDPKHWDILDSFYHPELAFGQGAGFLLNAIPLASELRALRASEALSVSSACPQFSIDWNRLPALLISNCTTTKGRERNDSQSWRIVLKMQHEGK